MKLLRGKTIEVPLTLNRLFPYDGPVQIEVVTGGAKGIEAWADALGANDDVLKLHLSAAADLPPGAVTITLRVTARFNDTPVVHEMKVPVNIK